MIAAENIENVLVTQFSQKTYSFVPNCRKWGGEIANCKFWEKTSQVHLIIIKE